MVVSLPLPPAACTSAISRRPGLLVAGPQQLGGEWLLRIDDLDTPRNRPGAIEAIRWIFTWLGLNWDGPVILQSQRRGHLRLLAVVVAAQRPVPLSLFPPRADRAADLSRHLPDGTPAGAGSRSGLPSWRLQVPAADRFGSGDVVLRRADGFIAYQLATVVDELCFGITDVVRGEDLRVALPAQRSVVSQLLGWMPPRFHHVPLLCDERGEKLSKRDGSCGLD